MSKRIPLLWCDTCEGSTRHVLARMEDNNGFSWSEYWRCLVCKAERLWGVSDPMKIDPQLTDRQRYASRKLGQNTWDMRCDYDAN